MKFKLKALALAAVASASTLTFAEETASEHSFSGNIGVLSSYVLRGNTLGLENSGATINGGLDYNHASGFYAGWWGSTLEYADLPNAFENDFYAGYNGSINDDLGYTLGLTYYYYYDVETSDLNGFETMLGLTYKDFGVTAQTLLEDTGWGNAGDTYIKGTYSYALPHDFSLDTALGLYYYSDSGDFEGEAFTTTEDFGFRHFDIGVSKAIADTGVTASMNYIIGGKLRDDTSLKNKVVLGLSYSF
ncbi:TorF family putative porin [Acinetobacter wanghuae]|uniref:TorF family putative porin n=1 Tax=Acinetobacter wanghuae TaxID=2662362 RepID=UPI003AF46629